MIRLLVLNRGEYGRLKEKLDAESSLIVWGKAE